MNLHLTEFQRLGARVAHSFGNQWQDSGASNLSPPRTDFCIDFCVVAAARG
jgi:hypothetical protein